MNNIKTIQINLLPFSTFFFGGERTLGPDNADYLVKSNYFPQQTALLGVLRYKILETYDLLNGTKINGKIKSTVTENGKSYSAADLIGPASFTFNIDHPSFGSVQNISPLFLSNGRNLYFTAPLNWKMEYKSIQQDTTMSLTGVERNFIPHISKGYDPKEGLNHQLIDQTGKTWNYDCLFQEESQVGIVANRSPFKTSTNKEQDKGFYKQTFLRFKKPELSFSYYATIEEETANKLITHCADNPQVPFGGEKSIFKMSVRALENPESAQDNYLAALDFMKGKQDKGQTQILLISDAYVENGIYKYCDFAITETNDFRNIITSVTDTTNYHDMKKNAVHTPNKSKIKFNLLKKGSVFYVPNKRLNTIIEKLEAPKHFRKIGFNAFAILKNENLQISMNDVELQNRY